MSQMKPFGTLGAMAVNNIQGRNVPTAQALQNRAHREAQDRGFILVKCAVEMLQPPHPQNNNVAIVKAVLQFQQYDQVGQPGAPIYHFEALGDADASGRVRPLALAETRSLSRALSLALNTDQEIIDVGGTPAAPQQQFNAPPPQQYQQPAQGGYPQQPAPQGYATPQQGGGWDGNIKWGKHNGKNIQDPSVSIDDLNWMSNNLTLQDRATPDAVKRGACIAEIQRRSGQAPQPMGAPPQQGYPQAPAPQQYAQPQQQYAPPPQQYAQPMQQAPAPMGAPMGQPGGFAPQPLPPQAGAPVFGAPPGYPGAPGYPNPNQPVAATAPATTGTLTGAPSAVSMPVAGQTIDSQTVAHLIQIAARKGYSYPILNQSIVQPMFQVADVSMINPNYVPQLEAHLNSLPNAA